MTQPIARILAATDFSPGACRAVERAAQLARQHDAHLCLVHAVGSVGWLGSAAGGLPLGLSKSAVFEAVEHALAQERARLCEQGVLQCDIAALDGALHQCLHGHLQEYPADIVVVGAHGEGGWRDALLGSTADRVLRLQVAPVLLVRTDVENGYRRVALASDFSEASEQAARLALKLVPEAVQLLVHANEPPFDSTLAFVGVSQQVVDDYRRQAAQMAMRELEEFVARLGEPGARILPALRDGRPASVLPAFVAEADIDLLVVGAEGRSPLSAHLLGSTSRHAAAGLACDVLVVPRKRRDACGELPE